MSGKATSRDRAPCRRCKGVGYTDIDILPGMPHEPCHRCLGHKVEPVWALSDDAWEIEFRRACARAETPIDLADHFVDMLRPKMLRLVRGRGPA